MHHLASLFSKCSLKFHIVSDTVRMHHLSSLFFIFFSAVPNRFKCRWNAPFNVLVFQIFCVVQNTVRMHHLASLFLKQNSRQFPIVSNAVRMHPLLSLFSNFCLQFQIISNTVIMYHLVSLFLFFLCSSKPFSNTVRMHLLLSFVFKLIRCGQHTTTSTMSFFYFQVARKYLTSFMTDSLNIIFDEFGI